MADGDITLRKRAKRKVEKRNSARCSKTTHKEEERKKSNEMHAQRK
jgi:hypothetical protein